MITGTSIPYVNLEKFIRDLGMKTPKKETGGAFMRIVGVVLILVVILGTLAVGINIANIFGDSFAGQIFFLVWSYLTLYVSYRVFLKGRRKEQVLKIYNDFTESRPPIVYLRSFADDDKGLTVRRFLKMLVPLYFNQVIFPKEEALSKSMRRIGPVLAIGQPGESVPGLGAAKVYTEAIGNKWQTDLNEILKVSKIVILRAGFTSGLEWEFRNVFGVMDPEKIMVYVDLNKEKYQLFRQKFQEWTRITLPDVETLPSMQFFIYFDKDLEYKISIIKTPFFRQRLYQPNTSPFIYGLKPLFERNSIPWTRPKRNLMLCFFAGVLILAVAVLVLMAIWLNVDLM